MSGLANSARAAVVEALDKLWAAAPPAARIIAEDDLANWAMRVVDESGILEKVRAWEGEARRGPGGAPRKFEVRAVLVAMVLTARLGRPMLATIFRDIMFFGLSPAIRAQLRLPAPPDIRDRRAMLASYRNVRTRFHGVADLVDPSVLPKNRRLSAADFAAAVERRSREKTPDEQATRYLRLGWLIGAIIEASLREMPRALRRAWRGATAVDGTPVPAFARPERRSRAGGRVVETHSADPDAGWYVRNPDARDTDTPWLAAAVTPKVARWSYEATLAVMATEEPGEDHCYPPLVVGMAPLDKPGKDVGTNAIRALANIRERCHPAGELGGDRVFSSARPETYQLPARALGYQHVFDYRIDQLGRQGSYGGAIQVDGDFYCPSMPEPLVTATADRRNGHIDDAVWLQRVAARDAYRFRPKGAPDAEGHVRLLCPASAGAPTARCELKPRSINKRTAGRTRIPLLNDIRDAPPKCCRQESVTFPPEAGAKFLQRYPHSSRQWRGHYRALRSTDEGMHGIVKDDAREALNASSRRRMRGRAAQSILAAFLIFGVNIRMIESFLRHAVATDNGIRRPRARRRTTEALNTWDPIVEARGAGPPPATAP